MPKLALSLIFALFLVACSKDANKLDESAKQVIEIKEDFRITRAKEYIASLAKDPKSLQFKDLFVTKNYTHVCGKVNGKNSFGGYTGFSGFSFSIRDSKLIVVDETDRDSIVSYTYDCFIL